MRAQRGATCDTQAGLGGSAITERYAAHHDRSRAFLGTFQVLIAAEHLKILLSSTQ